MSEDFWIPNDGLECPALARDAANEGNYIILRFRDNSTEPTYSPWLWRWMQTAKLDDIVGYRIVQPSMTKHPEKPQPTLADLLRKHREVKSELQDLVQKMFPVGAKVQVGENPSIAVVDHYRDEAPDLAFVKFENGNVWPKLVDILERVPDELQVQDVAQKCDE